MTDDQRRVAKAAYDRARRLRLGERLREMARARYRADPQKVRRQNAPWHAAHAVEVAAYQRQYRMDRREQMNDYNRRWRETEAAQATERAYRSSPVGRAADRAKGSRRRGAGRMAHATRDWCTVLLLDPCVYCGASCSTIDHIVPIVLGGTNDEDNLSPACRSCNSSKNDLSLLAYLLRENIAHAGSR